MMVLLLLLMPVAMMIPGDSERSCRNFSVLLLFEVELGG
jgi:hypothetical protein